MRPKKFTALCFAIVLALASVVILLGMMGGLTLVYADSGTRYVATTGTDTSNNCTNTGNPCRTIQHAVDQADSGDIILVATGVYADIHTRPVPPGYIAPGGTTMVTQVVYITKTIDIRGGYTTAFTEPPDPEANPTSLDAHGEGRVILIAGDITTTIEGFRITGGDATGLYGEGGPYDAGGGLYSTDGTTTIRDNLVFSNTAYFGGGLYLRSTVSILSHNTVFSNTANFGGGARLYRNDVVLVTYNTLKSNLAHAGGGLVVDYCDEATISGNKILSNTATSGVNGGLYLGVISGTISENTINANTASDQGGGVYMSSSDHATLISNTIAANSGTRGGGLKLWYSDASLIGNTITANTAENGGGLELWFSDATLDGNTIIANTATDGGGCGLYLGDSHATLINNVIVDNNTPTNTGSGLSIYGSAPQLVHTTIANNGGNQGYGVRVGSYLANTGSVIMTNTILTGHKWGIYVSPGNSARLESTLWNNTFDWSDTGTIITGTHNYWGDPIFAADGFHLMSSSPAIDWGIDAGVHIDIDGDLRPAGAGYDLGADEFNFQCTPLESVEINGPTIGITGTLYAFDAAVMPANASLPITYTWSPAPESGQGTAEAQYQWSVPGSYTITLAAENCGGSDEASHAISIVLSGSGLHVYLPAVMRDK